MQPQTPHKELDHNPPLHVPFNRACAQCGGTFQDPSPVLADPDGKHSNLALWLEPKLIDNNGKHGGQDEQAMSWKAILEVTADDLPRLMREGFHWTAANIHPEEGYVETDLVPDPHKTEEGYGDYSRKYFLADLAREPQWAAWLTIYASKLEVLSRFKVQDLTPDLVTSAEGLNKGRLVYAYESLDPRENFNSIYDDMPMEGWWPWPKGEADTAVVKRGEGLI